MRLLFVVARFPERVVTVERSVLTLPERLETVEFRVASEPERVVTVDLKFERFVFVVESPPESIEISALF